MRGCSRVLIWWIVDMTRHGGPGGRTPTLIPLHQQHHFLQYKITNPSDPELRQRVMDMDMDLI